jgi:hypothetical protein
MDPVTDTTVTTDATPTLPPTPVAPPAPVAAPVIQAPPAPAAPETRPPDAREQLNRLAEQARKSGSFKDCLLFQRARRAVVG